MLAHWAAQAWAWVISPPVVESGFYGGLGTLFAIVLTACLGISFTSRARQACQFALPFVAYTVISTLPGTPNHTILAALVIGLLACFDADDSEDGALLLQGLRWIAIIIFFHAGLQKALHGHYFQGQFLAWMIGHGPEEWAQLFSWILPEAEITRLKSIPRYLPGGGPYRVDLPLFLLLSNSVWVGEIVLAAALCHHRTRELAAFASILFVFLLQLAPREFMFALLYSQVLLLFPRGNWNQKLLYLGLFAYAWLLAAMLGAPGEWLLRKGGGGM